MRVGMQGPTPASRFPCDLQPPSRTKAQPTSTSALHTESNSTFAYFSARPTCYLLRHNLEKCGVELASRAHKIAASCDSGRSELAANFEIFNSIVIAFLLFRLLLYILQIPTSTVWCHKFQREFCKISYKFVIYKNIAAKILL